MAQEPISKRKEIIDFFLKKNILLSSDILGALDEKIDASQLHSQISEKINTDGFLILNKDIISLLGKSMKADINWGDLEKTRALTEKGKSQKAYSEFIKYIGAQQPKESSSKTTEQYAVNMVFNYEEDSKNREVQDFVQYFNSRYRALEKILKNRQELKNLISIKRLQNKRDRAEVSIIGMIKEKETTKNGNMILTMEDQTGAIKALINKNKPDLFKLTENLVLDEVIALVGSNGDNMLFVNSLFFPDVPASSKKAPTRHSQFFFQIYMSALIISWKRISSASCSG